ncbi:hypothetical protein JW777_07400 [bacterium]|nr:hypothetical protein [bacterium]
MQKTSSLVRLSLAAVLLAAAAPEVRAVDLQIGDAPGVGVRNRMQTDTTGHAAVNVGDPGENQVWDFTQPLAGSEILLDIVQASETPYAAAVPGAEWAIQSKQWLSLDPVPFLLPDGMEGFFDVYYYMKTLTASNEIQGLGMGAVTPFYTGGFAFTAPSTDRVYPMAIGTRWLKKYEFSAPANISGLSTTLVTKDSSVMEVDAFGRLTIPLGAFDCVRVKAVRHLTLKGLLFGNYLTLSVDTLIVYDWYAKDVGLVLEAASHSGEKNPRFADAGYVSRLSYTNVPSAVECDPGCGPSALRPVQYELSQNHPNPFNPSTAVHYRLAAAGDVTLTVFDILGKPVTVLESGWRPGGGHRAVWNGTDKDGRRVPSGVYFYRIEVRSADGAFTRTRKMILTD